MNNEYLVERHESGLVHYDLSEKGQKELRPVVAIVQNNELAETFIGWLSLILASGATWVVVVKYDITPSWWGISLATLILLLVIWVLLNKLLSAFTRSRIEARLEKVESLERLLAAMKLKYPDEHIKFGWIRLDW